MSTPSIKLNSIIERIEVILKEEDVAGVLCLYDNERVPGSKDGIGVAAIAEFLTPSFSGIEKFGPNGLKKEFLESVLNGQKTKEFIPEVSATQQMFGAMSRLLAQTSLKISDRGMILAMATGKVPVFKEPDKNTGTTNNN